MHVRIMSMNPKHMKQVNMANIRDMLRLSENATRAELAKHINVSTTTVRSLLQEMQQNEEIIVIGQDFSSGGRRAERYQLNPKRFCGATFCISDTLVYYFILDLFGKIIKEGSFPFALDLDTKIIELLEKELVVETLRGICIGVPGIVIEDGYKWKNSLGEFKKCFLGKALRERFHVPVVLENDLNLITMGMGKCHQQMHPTETESALNIGYIQFEQGCISAGFLSGGRLVRGFSNYAGELGVLPVGSGVSLVERLYSAKDIVHYSQMISTIIKWVAVILNPRYLTLGGPGFRKEAMSIAADILYGDMPSDALPEILYTDDTWNDYKSGLAAVCVDEMFRTLCSIGT